MARESNLDLQPVTLRLQKNLVKELKKLARAKGLGYQPFIRQILTLEAANLRENYESKTLAEPGAADTLKENLNE